ncbi:hypothetical protein I5G71_gp34 [Mycobacterium phage Patt]|uniref:Uncharacterized protein n=1 Tax=Mycobacterium phage Patt TaxID=2530139 RepID=A0A481VRE4_9CAUD|nr:hypothetical protein I5G71_gp34 [Mycobacterium phage Patt]AYQ98520.1 hypothetical protein SEA_REPTAR3000_34 [Mycobacterium phage Reptar3000]QBI96014.1 hypothetical protein SEA_MISSDAISY_34 [Mycobacterium phage MissDaisy]QBI96267.1 hypothetical protein SEA_PATT_34 [Mycobacterium phage Patt]
MSTEVIVALCSLVGVVVTAVLAHRAGGRAALRGAETADWKAFTDSLSDRLLRVEERLAKAEERTAKAEDRANRAESLYRIAIAYLRQVVQWCGERHGEKLPEVPAELAGDL